VAITSDSKTLNIAISHANSNRNKPIKQAVCDRGYVGAKVVLGANIILPKKALKRDNRYQHTPIKQEVLLINLKQQILWQFALQFSDEFVGNGSKAC
jgi:hypothetical protein